MWLQEYLHRQPTPPLISDCEKCMEATTRLNRQGRGCGYEPAAAPGVAVVPWQPPLNKRGYRHRPLPTICAGYTTRLPEVQEVERAYTHWVKGQLTAFTGGAAPSETLLACIEELDAEVSRLKVWALTPIAEGGGRE